MYLNVLKNKIRLKRCRKWEFCNSETKFSITQYRGPIKSHSAQK